MSEALRVSRGVQTAYLVFGTVEALGAALWSVAGAGIYGSPFAQLPGDELWLIVAFLVIGPCSILPAALLIFWRPHWTALWLMMGGCVSFAVSVPFLMTDAGILPWGLVSATMVGAGWMLRRVRTAVWLLIGGWVLFTLAVPLFLSDAGFLPWALVSAPMVGAGWLLRRLVRTVPASESSVDQGRRPWRAIGSVLKGVLLFFAGWIGTFVSWWVLVLSDVTSGPPYFQSWYGTQDPSRTVYLQSMLILAVMVVLLTVARRKVPIRGELIVGMWAGLFHCVLWAIFGSTGFSPA